MFDKTKEGTVKLFKTDKGYGFIANDKEDVFFHINDCGEILEDQLATGTKVMYEVVTDQKSNKKRAANIKLIA